MRPVLSVSMMALNARSFCSFFSTQWVMPWALPRGMISSVSVGSCSNWGKKAGVVQKLRQA
ncbi:MAG TPA: hypothetical protein GX513_11835 [Firmicutes bacterium]|nr:hypothetical protein [Bacillota bacterium]